MIVRVRVVLKRTVVVVVSPTTVLFRTTLTRTITTSVRIGNHKLKIETGRYDPIL